jgi:hypothetical protein
MSPIPFRSLVREALRQANGDRVAAAQLVLRRIQEPGFPWDSLKEFEGDLKAMAPTFNQIFRETAREPVGALDERLDARENPMTAEAAGDEVARAMLAVIFRVIREEAYHA